MDFFLLLALLVSACSDSSLLFQGGPCSSRSLSFALNEPCSVEQGAVCLDSSLLLARARRINSLCEEQGRVQLLCFQRTPPPPCLAVGFFRPMLSESMEPKVKTTKDTSTNFWKKGNHSLKNRVFLMQKTKVIYQTKQV